MKFILKSIGVASVVVVLTAVVSCKKTKDAAPAGGNSTYPIITDSVYNPVDPTTAATIGFFLNGWTGSTFTAPGTVAGVVPSLAVTDSLTIDLNKVITKVPKYVYGNNSNLWSGQMVTQTNLMQYLRDLGPNIIRAPAGSVSDVYFWNGTDANPAPADAPSAIFDAGGNSVSLSPWYGGNNAGWTFSLSNYYNLLTQTNSTGIITINYGYARYGTSANPVARAAHLAADWVRFDNGRTKFWEIGNENFGNWEAGYRINLANNHDGQPEFITGAVYGNHFKVFADSMKAAATQIGATIYVGALLFQDPPAPSDYTSVKTWNQGVLANAGSKADYFIVHSYFTPYAANSSVSDILSTGATVPANIVSYIQSQLSGAGVPIKPIAFTEWNIQATGSKQTVSYIAGVHAAKTIGAIIKNKFGEASRWDLANGYSNGDDMGLFNIGDEPNAPLWNPRPAFYYLYYFHKFFGDRMVTDTLRRINNDITTYSSTFTSGQAGTVIINSGSYNHVVSIDFQHFRAGNKYYWYVLTGGSDNGSFSGQVYVNGKGPATPTGGPLDYATINAYSAPLSGSIKITIPALSVVYLVAEKH
jgi:hypothetical protein